MSFLSKFSFILIVVSFSNIVFANNVSKSELEKIESYLNSLDNLEAEFIQINYDNTVNKGKFYMQKPKKIRFEYYDQPIIIISNPKYLIYYDSELEQSTYLDNKNNFAQIIAHNNIKFDKNIRVLESVLKDDEYELTIKSLLYDSLEDVSLVFDANNLALKSFILKKNTSEEVVVKLQDLKSNNINLVDSLFQIQDSRLK